MTRKRKQMSSEEPSSPRRWAQVPLLMDIGEPTAPSELSELERVTKRALKSARVFMRVFQAQYFVAITNRKIDRDAELLAACLEIRQRIGLLMFRFLGTTPQVAEKLPEQPWSNVHVLHYALLTNKQQLWTDIAQLAEMIERQSTADLRAWYSANKTTQEEKTPPTPEAPPKKVAAKRQRKSKTESEGAS